MRNLPSPTTAAAPRRRFTRRLGPAVAAGVLVAWVAACGSPASPTPTPAGSGLAVAPVTTPTPTPTASPTPTPEPTPSPSPTPVPTPVLVPDPLTGVLVTPQLAARHVIAVMVDDHPDARPQSGFTSASVVWQAPAEGGIPRYMMVFSDGNPASVGPVRSARLYFVQWASEWNAAYVHVGGSPQALALLQAKGGGQLVYNADEFRWGGIYLWRAKDRAAPHNVYTDAKHLRALATRLKATAPPAKAAWTFADGADLAVRPQGATIDIAYPWNKIGYRYDRASNTWLRLTGAKAQVDRATNQQVAPQNVVIMQVRFGLLGPGQKGRLEAATIGSGPAWIATNGTIVKGTWKKASVSGPTQFFLASGAPSVLTRGQTFVQVIPPGTPLKIVNGSPVTAPAGDVGTGLRPV
jgi:hypothetical protein